MSNLDNLCLYCMNDKGEEEVCPHCGQKDNFEQIMPFLPLKTVVADRYYVGRAIEHNGDGATYLAWDIERKRSVELREYLPDGLFKRNTKTFEVLPADGKENAFRENYAAFLDLWRKLARMRGLSALILVVDIVEDFGTAYAVSEHFEDISLRDYLLSSKTGYLSWEDARVLLMPVLSTLSTLHSAGIIHRGISPTTLFIGADKKVRIGGFCIGAARTAKGDIKPEIFSGYAPIEQYGFEGQQGPWTDIYAFSAILYRVLVGSTPLEATTRITNDRMMIPAKFAEQIPAYVINALINGLQILPEDRTRTVEQFRSELSASPSVTVNNTAHIFHNDIKNELEKAKQQKPVVVKDKKSEKDDKAVKTGIKVGLIVTAALLVIFLILWFTVIKNHVSNTNDSTETTKSSQSTTVTVPTFTGKTYTSIQTQKTYKTNFQLTYVEEYNTEVKAGYIISQSVEAGTTVEIGTEIQLTVSLGTEQITMIDVVGKTYSEALTALTNAGFKVTETLVTNDGSGKEGTVKYTSLTVGQQYDKGQEVLVQVYDVPDTTAVEVE